MPKLIDVRVPDIGDFKEVPVIEVLVAPGDSVKKEDPLVTLESEKATMEVPSPAEGTVKELKIQVGDKVSQGAAILTLSADGVKPPEEPLDDQRLQDNVEESAEVMEGPAEGSAAAQSSEHAVVELRVPDIGDFKDVPVIDVLVKPGEQIERDASLITLESEKAAFEVPANTGGIIREIAVKPGDKVSQDSLIATLETSRDSSAAAPVGAREITTETSRREELPQAKPSPSLEPTANGEVHASPSIRRYARELGVDLSVLEGSGPNGRITREDIQGFVQSALRRPSQSAGIALGIAPWPMLDFAEYGPVESAPLSRIKKIAGPNLHRNWVSIPHVTNNEDADITELEKFRQQLNRENSSAGVKVTLLAFLIKGVVAALQRFPDFNASLDGDRVIHKKYYNIGFAADTADGLLVPVLKAADTKGILAIAQEAAALAAKARDGKLAARDMQGGSFTISSLGGIGGTYFTPIINAPEVAILGVCRATMKPVWDGSAFVPRLILPLSLSYDHRIIDGAAAARFNAYLTRALADLRWTIV